MCSIKIQTEKSRENTNAAPALPIGKASALWASRGVHNKLNKKLINKLTNY